MPMCISIAQARTKQAPGISVWHFPCEFPWKMALANPIAYDEAALRSPHKLDSVDYYALHLLLGCTSQIRIPYHEAVLRSPHKLACVNLT